MSKEKKQKSAKKRAEAAIVGAEKDVEKAAKGVEQELQKAVGGKRAGARSSALVRPRTRVPEAVVFSRRGTSMISREGRGFSLGELGGAGVPPGLASKWGARVDPRRRTVLEANVSSLKAWHSRATPLAAAKEEARVIEAEVVEAAKEVAAGVKAAGREAKKLGKGAKKAGAAAKEKAEKKKPRKKSGS